MRKIRLGIAALASTLISWSNFNRRFFLFNLEDSFKATSFAALLFNPWVISSIVFFWIFCNIDSSQGTVCWLLRGLLIDLFFSGLNWLNRLSLLSVVLARRLLFFSSNCRIFGLFNVFPDLLGNILSGNNLLFSASSFLLLLFSLLLWFLWCVHSSSLSFIVLMSLSYFLFFLIMLFTSFLFVVSFLLVVVLLIFFIVFGSSTLFGFLISVIVIFSIILIFLSVVLISVFSFISLWLITILAVLAYIYKNSLVEELGMAWHNLEFEKMIGC